MKSPSFVLALDQGTTSSRTGVFDHAGQAVAIAQREFPQIYPRPGWVEHDPVAIWQSQRATITDAMLRAKAQPSDLAAVGITNQRETVLVWDRETGVPIYNAIVWQDRRTADDCERLRREGVEPMVSQKTGLRLDPYFSATKLRWILENVDGARAKAEQGRLLCGTVDTWLLWQMTAETGRVHATDATNASRTLLFNIHTGEWDPELLELFQIPRSLLPSVRASSEVYATADAATGIGGVRIAGVAGDQQAALFGQACFRPGMAKNTYGTGCFLLMNTGDAPVQSANNLLTTVAWKIGQRTQYALEGSVFVAGAAIQWLRDELKLVSSAQELDALAATVPDAGGLFLVPAFAGLGAPHWDPYARGALLGITRGASRAHLCRAALESIALQTADLLHCMEKDSCLATSELRVDGGASRSRLLLQLQADILGTAIVQPTCVETTAMGAAYLAGLAVGYWKDEEDIAQNWKIGARFSPERSSEQTQSLRTGWARALEKAKGWASA